GRRSPGPYTPSLPAALPIFAAHARVLPGLVRRLAVRGEADDRQAGADFFTRDDVLPRHARDQGGINHQGAHGIAHVGRFAAAAEDRKGTRLNSSPVNIT